MVELAFSNKYIYKLPPGHRFPIEKYELVKEQLVYEGTVAESQIYEPGLATGEQILRVHTIDYWHRINTLTLNKKEVRQIGLPVTEMSVLRGRNSVAGTLEATKRALRYGLGMNLSGGTHHAYSDHGEGFCLFNDLAVAAQYLIDDALASNIHIIDLDVHQGNGTASIFKEEPQVYTFSMHGEDNYPLRKELSDRDVGLPLNIGDKAYLTILTTELDAIFNRRPDFVFYQAGVDVLANDKLGKMALTREGARQRDRMVITRCYEAGIPLVITMGGGYAERLADLVEAHCNTFRTAIDIYS